MFFDGVILHILYYYFYEVTGCLAGGSFSCQNGGTCLNINGIGVCACLLNGFSGTYCSTPLGCNFTGCLNGGFCITSTGTCSCLIGYTGSTCSSSKFSTWKF